MTNKKQYEEYLNDLYDIETCLEQTEHCWAGKDKSLSRRRRAKNFARRGLYGRVLRIYDPIAFEVGFNESEFNK